MGGGGGGARYVAVEIGKNGKESLHCHPSLGSCRQLLSRCNDRFLPYGGREGGGGELVVEVDR